MKQINCNCNGENEKCFKCEGTGYYTQTFKSINNQPLILHQIEKNKIHELHLSHVTNYNSSFSAQLIESQRQLKAIPKSQEGKGTKGINIANSEGRSTKIECAICGAIMLERKIHKHKNKCKKLNNTRTAKTKKSESHNEHTDMLGNKFSAVINSAGDLHETKNACEKTKQIDGSREYFMIRENGKFGSHSLFDDMGDESTS